MSTTPEVEQEQAPEPEEAPETTATEPEEVEDPKGEDDLPDWVKEKIRKANNEAKNLRNRLKEQEPLVTAAQEAERAKMSELDRVNADLTSAREQLSQRDTELLQARYNIPDEYVEFIGEGTLEEKEARAAKVGLMVKAEPESGRPPSERPVESLKPGASPSTPPVEDHSYPASWGFRPQSG